MVKVRAVTEAEVAAFKQNGWAYLPQLISPEDAAELRDRAEARIGARAEGEGVNTRFSIWNSYPDIGRTDEMFASASINAEMGRNAARMLGRDSSIRLFGELVAVKLPVESGPNGERRGSDPTGWHQDWFTRGVDRTTMTMWIALNDIPPERGSMRFLNGSHKLGALGLAAHESTAFGAPDEPPLPERWPDLADCPISEPLHVRPGDATAHSAFVVHSAPANTTDEPRWVYILGLYPGDAVYNGQPFPNLAETGLEMGQVIDHPLFPLIYAPDS